MIVDSSPPTIDPSVERAMTPGFDAVLRTEMTRALAQLARRMLMKDEMRILKNRLKVVEQ